jgi:DNA-binding response OmpR family regulator
MHNAGAQAYLKKDVQAAELIAAIKRHARHVKGNSRQNAAVACRGPACGGPKGHMSV